MTDVQQGPYNFAAAITQNKNSEVVAELGKCADPDDIPEFSGQTLLHFSVSQKKSWAVQELLRMGADPNLLTLNRNTALDLALDPSSPASQEIVKMLLEKGAKKKTELTISQIHVQLEKKYKKTIAGEHPDMTFLKVVVRNHPQKEQGFVLDYMQRNSGRSPMHDAAEAGNADVLKFWLDIGLPPDLATRGGKTVFDFEMDKRKPSQEIFDIISFYRRKRAEDGRTFFEAGFTDETIIDIPKNATLADFRKAQSAVVTDTLLYRIARFGETGVLRDAVLASGELLHEDDLLRLTHAWKSVLELAAERGQAADLLDPRLWRGRRETFKNLISHLGPARAEELKAEELMIDVERLTLQTRAAKKGGYKL